MIQNARTAITRNWNDVRQNVNKFGYFIQMFLTWGQYAWNRHRFYPTNLFLHPKDDTWFKQWSDFGWFTGVAYA